MLTADATTSDDTGNNSSMAFLQGVGGASTLVLDALMQAGAKAMGGDPYLGTMTGGMLGVQQQPSSSSSQAMAHKVTHTYIHIQN